MAKSYKNATLIFGGIVRFDIKLLAAARDEKSEFHLVHQHADGLATQTSQQNYCTCCNTVVPYPALKKGLNVGSGIVVVEQAELDALKVTSSEEIVINKFVRLEQVDPIFFDKSYYLIPDPGKSKGKAPVTNGNTVAYEVLYQLLKSKGVAGVAKMYDRGREYNVFVRVFENGLIMHTIFTSAEVRELPEFTAPRNVQSNEQILKIGGELIDTLMGEFDPANVVSEYDVKLNALVEGKKSGAPSAASTSSSANTPNPTNDLMAALAASLANAQSKKQGA